MVKEKKIRTKEEKKKGRGGKRKGENFFEISAKKGEPVKRRKKQTPPQCLVWFRLNGSGSSQNGQNSLIHNWCIGGCWFSQFGPRLGVSKPVAKDMTNLLFRVHLFKSWNVRETPHKPNLNFILNFVKWSGLSPYILCIYIYI